MKTYEALMIFPTRLNEESLRKVLDRVRDEITKLKGQVGEMQVLGTRTFARVMGKQEEGQYVKAVLSLGPENVAALEARFKLIEELFRVQLTCRIERKRRGKAEAAAAPQEVPDHGVAQPSASDR